MADYANVSANFFETLALPLRSGRGFEEDDVARNEGLGEGSVIVNQALVDKFFPSVDPLRQRLKANNRLYSVVGVVNNYNPMGPEEGARPEIFYASTDVPSASLLVRTRDVPERMAAALRNSLRRVDPQIAASEIQTLESRIDEWAAQRRFNTYLLTVFAGLAFVLALVGVYGVLTNIVASRTREIGIRLALGSPVSSVARLIAAQSMIPVLIGIAAGIGASLLLGNVLESLLFEIHGRDPMSLGLAAAGIVLLAPLAISAPLWRATRVECTTALREE